MWILGLKGLNTVYRPTIIDSHCWVVAFRKLRRKYTMIRINFPIIRILHSIIKFCVLMKSSSGNKIKIIIFCLPFFNKQ